MYGISYSDLAFAAEKGRKSPSDTPRMFLASMYVLNVPHASIQFVLRKLSFYVQTSLETEFKNEENKKLNCSGTKKYSK